MSLKKEHDMMRRLVVLELFSGPGWRDVSDLDGHIDVGEVGAWLLIQPSSVQLMTGATPNAQRLCDASQGGPSFCCHVWHTTAGVDRPTVHTVASGDADLYEEVLMGIGFHLEEPDGIDLQKDESGAYWGYYI